MRCFIAVAQSQSFTRAAQQLYLAQPAVSRSVAALERELGAALFLRRPAVTLTPEGERLLVLATSIVEQVDAAAVVVRQAGATSTMLRIGLYVDVGHGLLADLVERFAADRPDVSIQWRHYEFDNLTAGVRDGGTDIGLVDSHMTGAGLARQPLHRGDERVALLASGSSLDEHAVVSIDMLDRSGLLFATPPTSDVAWARHATGHEARGGSPARTFVPTSRQDYHDAVTSGYVTGLTMRSSVEAHPRPGLTYRPVEGLPSYGTDLLYRACDAMRPPVRDFLEFAAFRSVPSLLQALPSMRKSLPVQHPETIAALDGRPSLVLEPRSPSSAAGHAASA